MLVQVYIRRMVSFDTHWGLDEHTLRGGGFSVSSVPENWRQIAVSVPSAGGAVGSLVNPGYIGYDTGWYVIVGTRQGKSGWIKSYLYTGRPLS